MKIQVCGYSGSGKSTFAKRLGEIYNIKVLHIDTINFGPNWVERDSNVINNEIKEFINHYEWIIDGNYVKHVSERFDLCDQFFFFNFNRFKCLYGAIRRYLKYRGKNRDSIANGCNEKIDWKFINWILFKGRTKKHKERLKMYKKIYKEKIIVFKNRKQVNSYLLKIGYKDSLKYL